jgi:hypothetical protein
MSRYLPPHPNLDHLKKQAKELLHDLKQRNPALKLADAQHMIARGYGFASWPKLKAHVELLPHPAAPAGAPSGDSDDGVMPKKVNPFVGTWTANLSKSRRHPNNQFQSATLQFAVTGDAVTIVDVVVDDAGREERGKNIILADGNEHPQGNGYVLTARWRDPQAFETTATKDGQIVGWGTYEVSADGKTLTISGDQQVIVLDRS